MRMLYVFKSPSCELCREAEPHLVAFEKENRGKVPVIRLNPNIRDWVIAGFNPRYTPSYAMVERATLLGAVEARLLTTEELRAFVANPSEFSASARAAQVPADGE